MSRYAILDGSRVIRLVEQADAPTVAHALIEPWVGIPANLSGGTELAVENGVLVWREGRTLAQAKALRIAVMRDAREDAIAGGFTWDGSTFDSDQTSQTRLIGLFTSGAFRLADNTWRTLSVVDMVGVKAALQQHVRTQFATFAARESSINAAPTIAAVQAINWGP